MGFIILLGRFIFLFLVVEGGIPKIGKCPEKTISSSDGIIDIRKLSGVWYEFKRSSSLLEWPFKCITFKMQPFFEWRSSLKITTINRMTGILQTRSMGVHLNESNGNSLVGNGKDGKFFLEMTPRQFLRWNVKGVMTSTLSKSTNVTLPLQLLALSPKWAMVWSCRQFDFQNDLQQQQLLEPNVGSKSQWSSIYEVWILSRERQIEDLDEIEKILLAQHLEHLVIHDVVQTDCAKETITSSHSNEDDED